MSNWNEMLPINCPPNDALNPNGKVFYRLGKTDIPSKTDFCSQRALQPSKEFSGVDECIACSISVFDNLEKCKKMLKLPRMRKRFKTVFEVNLTSDDGKFKKTFGENHYSWWMTKSFDINTVKLM